MNSKINYAAQNAKEGLINAMDLSLLIGVDAARLNNFAKKGYVNHYGEYHGKRFFNFEEIVKWLHTPDNQSEAKPIIQAGIKGVLEKRNCPYTLKKDDAGSIKIVWKE